MSEVARNAAYDLWLTVRKNIYEHWTYENDPANLKPLVRPLNINRKVADFVLKNIPLGIEQTKIDKALNIVEAPWSGRDKGRLRKWFAEESNGKKIAISN